MSRAIQKSRESKLLLKKSGKQKKQSKLAEKGMAVLFAYLVLVLLGFANVLLYESVFQVDGSRTTYFFCMAGIGLLLMLCYGNKQLGKKAHVIIAAFYALGGFFLRKEICEGGQKLINHILYEFQDCHGIYVPTFSVQEAQVSSQTAVIFVAAVFLWWIAIGLFRMKNIWFTIVPSILIFCTELLVGISPKQRVVFLVFLCGMGVVALCKGKDLKESRETQKIRAKSGVLLVFAFACCLWLAVFFGKGQAAALVEKYPEMIACQRAFEEKISNWWNFELEESRNRAISNEAPVYENVTVLQVTMQTKPEGVYYLRGYVGDTYKNGKWSSSAENADISVDGKDIQNLLYNTQKYQSEQMEEEMTIQYLEEDNKYAYLPYQADMNTVELSGKTGELSYVGDAQILRNGAEQLTVSGNLTGLHFENVSFMEQANFPENEREQLYALEEAYQEDLQRYLQFPSGLTQLRRFGEELTDEFEEKLVSDQAYDTSILPREALAAYIVRSEIASRASYSLNLEEVPQGEDIIQYFLFGSGKGFCQHYASAGTLLLRSMGVPARYVTGYTVSAGDFVEQENGSYIAEVKDSKAHAWVEYYQPGVGWVPIDMTEGTNQAWDMYSTTGESDMSEQSAQLEKTEEPASEQTEEEQQTDNGTEKFSDNENEFEKNDGQNMQTEGYDETEAGEMSLTVENDGKKSEDSGWSKLVGCLPEIIGAIGCVAAVILLVYGVLWYRNKRIWKEFCQKNYRRAIKSISYHVYHLLLRKGVIKSRHMDDREYRKQFLEKVLVLSKEEKLRYLEVLQRAYYSNAELEREDALFCRNVYKKIKLLK